MFSILLFYIMLSNALASSVRNISSQITSNVLNVMKMSIDKIPQNYQFDRDASSNAMFAVKTHFKQYCVKELTRAQTEVNTKIPLDKSVTRVLTKIGRGFKNICIAAIFSVYRNHNNL